MAAAPGAACALQRYHLWPCAWLWLWLLCWTPPCEAQRVQEYNLWVCPHCERGVKVADVMDLSCESEEAPSHGFGWSWVKQALYRYLHSLSKGHPGQTKQEMDEMQKLLEIASESMPGECYLGVLSLGFFALQFMDPDERYNFIRTTIFGGTTLKRVLPISSWDVLASGWPLFGILAASSTSVQADLSHWQGDPSMTDPNGRGLAPEWQGQGLTGISLKPLPGHCCDFPIADAADVNANANTDADGQGRGSVNDFDQVFLMELAKSLGTRTMEFLNVRPPLDASVALTYLAESSQRRCSWGRAAAYFALVETLLVEGAAAPTSFLRNSTQSLMQLGERNLDGCVSNVTVYHLMQSVWPFWQIMGRLEQRRLDITADPLHPAGPGARTPQLASSETSGAKNSKVWLRPINKSIALKWKTLNRQRTQLLQPQPQQQLRNPGLGCQGAAHVALSADLTQIDGLLVTLQSASMNAREASSLCFHVFVLPSEMEFVRGTLRCAFGANITEVLHKEPLDPERAVSSFRLASASMILLHPLNATFVWTPLGYRGEDVQFRGTSSADGIDDKALSSDTGNLGAVHNFVRFVLHDLLPELSRVVYLDVDIVVKGDLLELFDLPTTLPGGEVATLAAVPRLHQALRVYVDVLQPAMPSWIPSEAPSFNAGVLVIDLERWRARGAVSLVADWLQANARRRLWLHGSQPPLLLLFHDELAPLDWSWNVDGLGHRLNYPKDVLGPAKVLHWTGPLKPWRHHGVNRLIWEKYTVEYCPEFSFREHTTTCRPDSWFC